MAQDSRGLFYNHCFGVRETRAAPVAFIILNITETKVSISRSDSIQTFKVNLDSIGDRATYQQPCSGEPQTHLPPLSCSVQLFDQQTKLTEEA